MFGIHTRIDDYIEELAGYRSGAATVPVLARDAAAVRRVAALHDPAVTHRPVPDTSGTVVVAPAGSPLAPVAQALASALGGDHVAMDSPDDAGDVIAKFPRAPYLLFLGLGDELTEKDVLGVHDQLWEEVDKGFRGSMGIISAERVEDVSWMIAKGLAFPHRRRPETADVRLWPAIDAAAVPARGKLLLRQDTTADTLGPLLRDTHQGLLSVVAHGRDDVLHMHDTVICAARPDKITDPDVDLSKHPVCAFTGQCFRFGVAPDRILRADQSLVDAVFSNACMSWRTGDGLFPNDYLLTSGFLRGAAAGYVGSPNLVSGIAKLNDFFHAASLAGASLGEATALVNDHLRYEQTDPPYYTLLGLPWVTLEPAETRQPQPAGITVRAGGGNMSGGVAAAVDTLSASEQTGHTVQVLRVSPRSAALFTPETGRPQSDNLTDELGLLGVAIESLGDLPHLGLRYSRHSNIGVNLRDQLTSLATVLQEAMSLGNVGKIRRRTNSLRRSVEQAEQTLTDVLYERGTTSFVNFDDLWGAILERLPGRRTSRTCPHCDRDLTLFTAVHPLLKRARRETAVCARCGAITDMDPRAPLSGMELRCPETWRRGERTVVELVVVPSPDLNHELPIWVAAHTENCISTGIGFPEPRRIVLVPGTEAVMPFEAEISTEAQMHQQYLRGLTIVGGTVNYASKPVWVRPA